jgi:hypothetical protein
MFGSSFKESKMGPDDPIPLKDVDAPVFESVLRWKN